jgi:hypothetical protein
MNTFYQQPKILQWILSLSFLIIGFLPAIYLIDKGHFQPFYYTLFLFYIPISQFANTPFFRLIGIYKYYSPMLLGYMANQKQIDLHSGGSFDYLFVMKNYKAGNEMRNRLLLYHLEGLLHLIDLIEQKSIPETVEISGTSYFFKDQTMRKIGFELEQPTLFYRINLFLNCIDLIWMYSLSRGTISIPKIWNAKKVTISGTNLVKSKTQLETIYFKLKSRTKSFE